MAALKRLEAVARIVVLASAAGALAVELWLASGSVHQLPWIGGAAFVVGFAGARSRSGALLTMLFALCYVLPQILGHFTGIYIAPYFSIWLAALLGVALADVSWTRWSVPPSLRLPIVLWSATLALAWPIVVLREYDFTSASARVSNTSVGVPPFLASLGVADTAAILLTGMVWLDSLFARYAGTDGLRRYQREVLGGLALGAAAGAAVGLVQATIDISFLNGGVFPDVGRAAGMMRDANPYGLLTALWGPAAVALVVAVRGRISPIVTIALLLASWCGLWVSGSRNAMIVGAVGAVFVVVQHLRALKGRARVVLIGWAAALAIVAAGFGVLAGGRILSPVARLRQTFTGPSDRGTDAAALVARVWDPYLFGKVSGEMIRESPWVGVGPGSFSLLVRDFAQRFGLRLSFDNAQNWFRHQFVEYGILGSAGWAAWVAAFGWLLVRGRSSQPDRRRVISTVRILPLLVALASLVGMPAMNAAVSVTFWAFALWYVSLIDRESLDRPFLPSVPQQVAWSLACATAIAFLTGTAIAARGDLRVPHRAERFDWPYEYGMYPREVEGSREFSWTSRHAVSVVEVPPDRRWIRISAWIHHPDAQRDPVEVSISCGRKRLLADRLADSAPRVVYARVPDGQPRVMIEVSVGRTWRPADSGNAADSRELGAAVSWEFVATPRVAGRQAAPGLPKGGAD